MLTMKQTFGKLHVNNSTSVINEMFAIKVYMTQKMFSAYLKGLLKCTEEWRFSF